MNGIFGRPLDKPTGEASAGTLRFSMFFGGIFQQQGKPLRAHQERAARGTPQGLKLGRPAGSTASAKELLAKHADIVRKPKESHSVRNTATITGKGGSTVQRVKVALVGIR
jgi:hypothetical protein